MQRRGRSVCRSVCPLINIHKSHVTPCLTVIGCALRAAVGRSVSADRKYAITCEPFARSSPNFQGSSVWSPSTLGSSRNLGSFCTEVRRRLNLRGQYCYSSSCLCYSSYHNFDDTFKWVYKSHKLTGSIYFDIGRPENVEFRYCAWNLQCYTKPCCCHAQQTHVVTIHYKMTSQYVTINKAYRKLNVAYVGWHDQYDQFAIKFLAHFPWQNALLYAQCPSVRPSVCLSVRKQNSLSQEQDRNFGFFAYGS